MVDRGWVSERLLRQTECEPAYSQDLRVLSRCLIISLNWRSVDADALSLDDVADLFDEWKGQPTASQDCFLTAPRALNAPWP